MTNSDENIKIETTIDINDLKSLASEGADISQMLKNLNLSDSNSITHLKIINCEDAELDLREYINKHFKNIQEVIIDNSFNISDVHVYDGVTVYAPRPNDILGTQITEKVSVHSYDKDEKEKIYTVPGRLYKSKDNEEDRVNNADLNETAPFNKASVQDDPSLERIRVACRHLAAAVLEAYQKHANDKNEENEIAQKLTATYQELFGDVNKITNNVGSEYDKAYYNLLFKAQKNHIVGHSQWGKLSKDIFSGLEINDRKQVLFTTGNHAMVIEYSVKENAIGEKEYAMKLYDPNYTLTHRRVLSDNLTHDKIIKDDLNQVSEWKMSDFFSEQDIQLYFGNDSKQEQVSHFTIVPNNFFETYSKSLQTPSERSFSFDYLSPEERENSALFFHLLSTGAPLDELERQVDLAATENKTEKIIKILTAENSEGWSGLYMALQFGHAETIEKWGKILEKHHHLLTNDQLVKLLAPEGKSNVPGLHMAMQNGHAEAIKNWGNILENFVDRLENDQIINLLENKNDKGIPGLYTAMQEGHHEVIKNWWGIVEKLEVKLEKDQIVELLTAKDDQGISGLWMAMQNGNTDAVRSFGNILKKQKQEGNLTDDQIIDLLKAKNKNGISPLSIALYNFADKPAGNADVIECFGEILNDLGLTPTQRIEVLLSDNPDIPHGLFDALKRGETGGLLCFKGMLDKVGPELKELKHSEKLKNLFTDNKPTPSLWTALNNNQENAIDVFGEIFILANLPPETAANVLRAYDNKTNTPGLYAAMQNGSFGAVASFGNILNELKEEENLKDDQIIELLKAQNENGVSALSVALYNLTKDEVGNADVIECFGEILNDLGLTPTQRIEVLLPDNPNPPHGLFCALESGETGTLRYFMKMLKKAEPELKELKHSAKLENLLTDNKPIPSLWAALNETQDANAIKVFGEILILANLPPETTANVLRAYNEKTNTPGLYAALEKGSTEAIEKYGEIIEKSNLQPDQVVELLAAKNANGKLGIETAIEKGNIEALKVFAKVTIKASEKGNTEAMKTFAKVVIKASREGKLDLAQTRHLTSGIPQNTLQKAANEVNHLLIPQEINKLTLERPRSQGL